jgi:hypothetical protein
LKLVGSRHRGVGSIQQLKAKNWRVHDRDQLASGEIVPEAETKAWGDR